MSSISREHAIFKQAVIISIFTHLVFFILILLSSSLPRPSRKEMTHYVNVISFSGGSDRSPGGRGGRQEEYIVETQIPTRESLSDLTTPQNFSLQKPPTLAYPVEKPHKDKKPKKAVIKKSPAPQNKKKVLQSGADTGTGPRLGIGIGEGTGGGYGFGPGYGDRIGFSNVPFAYYLKVIHGRISSNWITAQINTGLTGRYYTVILFKIFRNGQISEPQVVDSTGVRTMDLSAVRAIRNSTPFPPIPPEYEDEYMQIRLFFEHSK